VGLLNLSTEGLLLKLLRAIKRAHAHTHTHTHGYLREKSYFRNPTNERPVQETSAKEYGRVGT
jgi:hypothetical protein